MNGHYYKFTDNIYIREDNYYNISYNSHDGLFGNRKNSHFGVN